MARGDLTDAVFCRAYRVLRTRLMGEGAEEKSPLGSLYSERLAAVAVLGAWTPPTEPPRRTGETHFARLMGATGATGGKAAISDARFRALMACQSLDDAYLLLLRIVRALPAVDLPSLADGVMRWGVEGPSLRAEWAEQYYSAAERPAAERDEPAA